jgi:predicted GNAT family acetyltransferase
MGKTTVVIDDSGTGELQLFENEVKAGKMNIAVSDGRLTVFHTEVAPAFEGRGFAKLLLDQLVSYARAKALNIVPLCPYVNAQFRRHPETYADVWSTDWHS